MKNTMFQAMSRITESFESAFSGKEDVEETDKYSVREAVSRDNWKIYQLMSSFFPEDGECQEESSECCTMQFFRLYALLNCFTVDHGCIQRVIVYSELNEIFLCFDFKA